MSKRSIIGKLAGTVLLAGCMLAGTMNAYAEEEKVLNVAWGSDMQTMDVHKTSSNYCIPLVIFDRLFEIQLNDDVSTELVKSLVDDYSISDDGLTYTFKLRDDVKFSNGTPLTAYDVEYTFTRMLGLDESVQTDFGAAIAGADELMNDETDTLSGFEVQDDYNFTVTLSEPFAGFIYQLATASCSIMSKDNVEEAGDDFGLYVDTTVGSGPYILKEWNLGSDLTLEANPDYWGEQPSAQTVHIQIISDPGTMDLMFQSGEIDILDCDFIDSVIVESTYKTAYEDQIVPSNRLAITYVVMNENYEPFSNVDVRKATQMAIDRQRILDEVYNGEGQLEDGIYPHGIIGFNEENQGWLQYDPEGAKALLEQAGYADGFDLELSADSSASSSVMDALQYIQQDLEAVGINAHIETYDEASWLDLRKSGEMQSFIATWTADFNDPDNFIYTFFGGEEKTKIRSLNYYDTETMADVVAARAIVDDAEREAEYARLEKKIVQEDAAWIPMYGRTHLFVINTDKIEHFTPHWAGYSDFSFVGVTMK